ncbi:Rap1a/Tai family immunity protein [Pleionea sediminis]|uniref:Rap1a/Tai family immunity protein n=1 Tax=Pleionea sediminis TaxID=2569479 RepID=UPI00118616F4|nr:Rap1a/Tai family immunity protein [Pleionea sediminis]
MGISSFKQSKSLFILLSAVFSSSLLSQEMVPLNGSRLIASCKEFTSTKTPNICAAYLQGFLDASPHVIEKGQLPSEFVIRAIKTRIPKNDVTSQAINNAKYCIPKEKTIFELAKHIADVNYSSQHHRMANSLVVSILDTNYRCDL